MDRREHKMACQGRLNGNLRRFWVADFADHDLVGVVPQDRAQPARKRQSLLFVDGNLGDPAELIFDRVLNRDDLVFN